MQARLAAQAVLATLTILAFSACGPGTIESSIASEPDRLPLIVAHRAGAGDEPENTLIAIESAIRNRADAIWLTVQLSRDGVPVLYRPADLSANTQASGTVAGKTFAELRQLNAGWNFERIDMNGAKTRPYRSQPQPIPSLQQALQAIPESIPVILDMKAVPAEPQAQAVARVLDAARAWARVTIYSTDAAYQKAFAGYGEARLFESRDATRTRLASVALAHDCASPPQAGVWTAFEYRRKMELVETFTLGEARSAVTATLWTPESVACFRKSAPVKILAIGVDNPEDYRAAACLGIDAVLADSPQKMRAIKMAFGAPLRCQQQPAPA
jgi:glycerophosphoryl diester phosphodiesterase